LATPVFNQGDDPIAYLNKAMDFLIVVASLSYKGNDPGIPDDQAAQTTIPNTVAFQTNDLDAYDSDCDDVSNAKAVLMANLSSYGSDVLLEVLHSETSHNDMVFAKNTTGSCSRY
ncbi:hypothetical protein Tco_0166481, partial [Tanacetum coccineum]